MIKDHRRLLLASASYNEGAVPRLFAPSPEKFWSALALWLGLGGAPHVMWSVRENRLSWHA